MNKSEVARNYVRQYSKNGVLLVSKKKLAETMFKKEKPLFKSNEDARSFLRFVTGTCGKSKRSIIEKVENPFTQQNQWGIPEEHEMPDTTPFVIDEKHSPALVIADTHFPYHDKKALEATLNYGIKQNCKSIILNGDIPDFYEVSSFLKDPRARKFKDELDELYVFINALKKQFGFVFYKLGNHDERYYKYLFKNAPLLFEAERVRELVELDNILDMGGNAKMIKDKRIIKLGNLNVIHGHEFGKEGVFSPVNAARGYFIKSIAHVLSAHKHQTSYHPQKTINGDVLGSWSVGCLCHMNPQYAPLNKWNHGFAIVSWNNKGHFSVDNKTIINNIIYAS